MYIDNSIIYIQATSGCTINKLKGDDIQGFITPKIPSFSLPYERLARLELTGT